MSSWPAPGIQWIASLTLQVRHPMRTSVESTSGIFIMGQKGSQRLWPCPRLWGLFTEVPTAYIPMQQTLISFLRMKLLSNE